MCRENDSIEDEAIVFSSQRLCQMLTTFDSQWSKQTSIPTILLHGADDINSIVDYVCRQSGYHCHTVSEREKVFSRNNSIWLTTRYRVNYLQVIQQQQLQNVLNKRCKLQLNAVHVFCSLIM